jgi:hypothetical protein
MMNMSATMHPQQQQQSMMMMGGDLQQRRVRPEDGAQHITVRCVVLRFGMLFYERIKLRLKFQ